jgi:hypothetical protein
VLCCVFFVVMEAFSLNFAWISGASYDVIEYICVCVFMHEKKLQVFVLLMFLFE